MKLFIEKKWLLITAAATLILSGCTSIDQKIKNTVEPAVETQNEPTTKNQRISAEFVRHVDGDTSVLRFDGKEQKVRFLLIDTPETVNPNAPVQPFGREASERTKELLTNAAVIEVEQMPEEKVDRYNRSLVFIFVDGQLLQSILVREGLARIAYVSDPYSKYLPALKQAENEAKSNNLGIWSIPGYVTNKGFK